jgi:hypothetical protein
MKAKLYQVREMYFSKKDWESESHLIGFLNDVLNAKSYLPRIQLFLALNEASEKQLDKLIAYYNKTMRREPNRIELLAKMYRYFSVNKLGLNDIYTYAHAYNIGSDIPDYPICTLAKDIINFLTSNQTVELINFFDYIKLCIRFPEKFKLIKQSSIKEDIRQLQEWSDFYDDIDSDRCIQQRKLVSKLIRDYIVYTN